MTTSALMAFLPCYEETLNPQSLLRTLATATLLAVTAFVHPGLWQGAALAAPEAKKPQAAPVTAGSYLEQLLNEINARRAIAGTVSSGVRQRQCEPGCWISTWPT